MTEDNVYDTLTQVFRETLGNQSLVAAPKLTAKDIEEWDSLNHIRIILAIETAFSISFSTPEISSFETVGDLANLIQEKTAI